MGYIEFSVDGETAGSICPTYSLLQIGACLVDDPDTCFEMDLRPINDNQEDEAMAVTGLTLARQREIGTDPEVGMPRFAEWVASVAGDRKPVFVGLAAAFDWQFFNYYLRTYASNPFGFAPLDIKAYYMGRTGLPWSESTSSRMDRLLGTTLRPDHTPLGDVRYQAELYRLIRDWAPAR